MPGYILHLTAAQMFLKQTKKEQELFVNKQETNNFLIGNLMPDTTKDKARSHILPCSFFPLPGLLYLGIL